MTEFVTRAFVLGRRMRGEMDLTVDLYTESMGRIEGRVISGQKISSRFSPHLNVFNLITVRMVEKNTLTVTDVLTVSEFPFVRSIFSLYEHALSIFFLLRISTPQHVPDPVLWKYLVQSMSSGAIEIREVLKILGHDTVKAVCVQCKKTSLHYFEYEDGIFFCETCGSKQARDKVILIV